MRPIELSLPFNRLARMLASFSVRTRIVLLALIPVVGFVANGLTFTAGEGDVGRAFATVTHSTALADVSRDFKSAVASMRIIVKDFSVSPDNNLVVSFEQAHATALKALETLAASIDRNHSENIEGLRKDLMSLRGNFNELMKSRRHWASTTRPACERTCRWRAMPSSASSTRTCRALRRLTLRN